MEQFEKHSQKQKGIYVTKTGFCDFSNISGQIVWCVFWSLFFLAWINFYPETIGLYYRNAEGFWNIIPFFDANKVARFLPIINFVGVMEMSYSLLHIVFPKHGIFKILYKILINLFTCIELYLIFLRPGIWNDSFFDQLRVSGISYINVENLSRISLDTIESIGVWVLIIIAGAFILEGIVNICCYLQQLLHRIG